MKKISSTFKHLLTSTAVVATLVGSALAMDCSDEDFLSSQETANSIVVQEAIPTSKPFQLPDGATILPPFFNDLAWKIIELLKFKDHMSLSCGSKNTNTAIHMYYQNTKVFPMDTMIPEYSHITQHLIESIARFCPTLSSLSLTNYYIANEAIIALGNLTTLTYLNLNGFESKVNDDGYDTPVKIPTDGFRALENLTNLKELEVDWSTRSNDTWKVINKLKNLNLSKLPNLTTLNLTNDAPFRPSDLASLSRLKDINLAYSDNIDTDILEGLAEFVPSVKYLYLTQCENLTDNAIMALSAFPNLKYVDLEDCQNITAAGISSMLEESSSIEEIDASNTAATPEELNELQTRFPDIKIIER